MVLGSAMLLYGGLVDMKGSSHEFWRLDFGQCTPSWAHSRNSCQFIAKTKVMFHRCFQVFILFE